jgi:hypothetical protein
MRNRAQTLHSGFMCCLELFLGHRHAALHAVSRLSHDPNCNSSPYRDPSPDGYSITRGGVTAIDSGKVTNAMLADGMRTRSFR